MLLQRLSRAACRMGSEEPARPRMLNMGCFWSHDFHASKTCPPCPPSSCPGVFEIDGQRWVRLVVIGQSFMLHQIRKMVRAGGWVDGWKDGCVVRWEARPAPFCC